MHQMSAATNALIDYMVGSYISEYRETSNNPQKKWWRWMCQRRLALLASMGSMASHISRPILEFPKFNGGEDDDLDL